MAILAECPICHSKQSNRNKMCSCGEDLDKGKRSKRVKYWISYRMPDGKQRRESVGAFEGLDPFSISDARDAKILEDLNHLLKSCDISLNTLAFLDCILGIIESLTELLDSRGNSTDALLLEILNSAEEIRE